MSRELLPSPYYARIPASLNGSRHCAPPNFFTYLRLAFLSVSDCSARSSRDPTTTSQHPTSLPLAYTFLLSAAQAHFRSLISLSFSIIGLESVSRRSFTRTLGGIFASSRSAIFCATTHFDLHSRPSSTSVQSRTPLCHSGHHPLAEAFHCDWASSSGVTPGCCFRTWKVQSVVVGQLRFTIVERTIVDPNTHCEPKSWRPSMRLRLNRRRRNSRVRTPFY